MAAAACCVPELTWEASKGGAGFCVIMCLRVSVDMLPNLHKVDDELHIATYFVVTAVAATQRASDFFLRTRIQAAWQLSVDRWNTRERHILQPLVRANDGFPHGSLYVCVVPCAFVCVRTKRPLQPWGRRLLK